MLTIRKALITEFGDESKVVVVDEDIPAPTAKEVQVRVEFSGFSGADINMRRGTYPFQKKAPLTPGYCFVGRVQANGSGCTRFQQGDPVAGLSIYGAEAELINQPEKYLVPVPPGLDTKQATALVLDWNTAYGMVMHAAHVKAGQMVFVHGLSGAVGHALLTLSKLQGAQVFGTASPKNHAGLIELGASPFAYSDKSWINAMQSGGGVDVVFDALGFESYDESYSILRQGGRLVAYGLNLPALLGTPPRPVLPAVIKLLARNLAFWSGKKTILSAHSLFSGAGTICHSPTGQSMELAPGDADKIERLQFGCFFSSRKGPRNRTDSSNARRPATGRVLERCYW